MIDCDQGGYLFFTNSFYQYLALFLYTTMKNIFQRKLTHVLARITVRAELSNRRMLMALSIDVFRTNEIKECKIYALFAFKSPILEML